MRTDLPLNKIEYYNNNSNNNFDLTRACLIPI